MPHPVFFHAMSAFDIVAKKVPVGTELKTPDKSTGKPFRVESIDHEAITVRTARGGRVKMSLFTFDSASRVCFLFRSSLGLDETCESCLTSAVSCKDFSP